MALSWLKAKPVPTPTDLELELVEALEAVTDCVEEHHLCDAAAQEGRATLDHPREQLGIVERSAAKAQT